LGADLDADLVDIDKLDPFLEISEDEQADQDEVDETFETLQGFFNEAMLSAQQDEQAEQDDEHVSDDLRSPIFIPSSPEPPPEHYLRRVPQAREYDSDEGEEEKRLRREREQKAEQDVLIIQETRENKKRKAAENKARKEAAKKKRQIDSDEERDVGGSDDDVVYGTPGMESVQVEEDILGNSIGIQNSEGENESAEFWCTSVTGKRAFKPIRRDDFL